MYERSVKPTVRYDWFQKKWRPVIRLGMGSRKIIDAHEICDKLNKVIQDAPRVEL